MPLVEDVALQSGSPGSMTEVVNEDGSTTMVPIITENICPHNLEFFTNPDYEQIVNSQRAEIDYRNAQAAAAAASANPPAAEQPQE